MRYLVLSLRLISALSLSTSAAAAVTDSEKSPVSKDVAVYYRCENKQMDFNEESKMREVSPGRYTLSVNATAETVKDACIVSLVEGASSKGELNFTDYTATTTKKDSALVNGKTYALSLSTNQPVFNVNYENAGTYMVEFQTEGAVFKLTAVKTVITNRAIATK